MSTAGFAMASPNESIVIHFSPGAVFKQVPVALAYRYFLAPLWKVIVESHAHAPQRREAGQLLALLIPGAGNVRGRLVVAEPDRRFRRQEWLGRAGLTGRIARRGLVRGLALASGRRLGQRDWAWIMATGKLDQRLDPAVDRGVSCEQVGEARARIVDAHLHDGGGRAFELAAVFDLAQRADHGVWVLGELDRPGIGQELALAREREANHDRQEPGDRNQRDRNQDRRHGAALAAVAAAAAARAAPVEPALEQRAEHELGKERDHARDDHRNDQQPDVAVANVRELMAEHR